MKEIYASTVEDFQKTQLPHDKAAALVRKIQSKWEERFGETENRFPNYSFTFLLHGAFTPCAYLLGEPYEGKVLVDLGCGSNGGSQDHSDAILRNCAGQFEPWLCRAFHELGVRCIGFDVGDLEGEDFEHHSIDLTQKGSLDMITSGSVDLVTAIGLFPSTELAKRMYGKTYSPSNHEERFRQNDERRKAALKDLSSILFPQLERILKPEGIFYYT